MSAAVPHTQLFLPESESEFSDEKRILMDDLKISHGSVNIDFHKDSVNFTSRLFFNYNNFVFRRITKQTFLLEKKNSLHLIAPCHVWLKCRPRNIGNSGSTIDNGSFN